MAKIMKPRFKECRRLGLNVYGHPKAMDRATRGTSRSDRKLSNYGEQLLEKQRLRTYYGVLEKQMVRYAKEAKKSNKLFGTALLEILETRLDNLVYRIGFANSIRQARQMVVHGHILVNGNRVNIPSYHPKVGDSITLREKSRSVELFKDNYENAFVINYPYLNKDKNSFTAVLTSLPEREDIPIEINDQLVVEFYSKIQ